MPSKDLQQSGVSSVHCGVCLEEIVCVISTRCPGRHPGEVIASYLLPALTTACKGFSLRPTSWHVPQLISETDFPSSQQCGHHVLHLLMGGASVEVRECHLP